MQKSNLIPRVSLWLFAVYLTFLCCPPSCRKWLTAALCFALTCVCEVFQVFRVFEKESVRDTDPGCGSFPDASNQSGASDYQRAFHFMIALYHNVKCSKRESSTSHYCTTGVCAYVYYYTTEYFLSECRAVKTTTSVKRQERATGK